MTGFVAEIDPRAAEAAEEAAKGGSGGFPPLPAGAYQAYVAKVVGTEKFGGSGGNANKQVVRIQVQIVDESPTGRKRSFFVRVPLFTRFAPTEKNPQGAPARGFWDFWEKAMGWSRDLLITGQLPGPSDIGGKPLTIKLGAPKEPDAFNPLGYNEVDFFDAPGDINATPQTPVRVPWLDDHGNLVAGYVPKAAGARAAAPAPAAPSAPPAWGGGAPAQAAPPAPQAPAYAQPPAAPQQAPQAPAGPPTWTPAPADAAYAQQAAAPAAPADALAAAAAQASGY